MPYATSRNQYGKHDTGMMRVDVDDDIDRAGPVAHVGSPLGLRQLVAVAELDEAAFGRVLSARPMQMNRSSA